MSQIIRINIAYIKLSAKSHSFNILCTMDGLSCPTTFFENCGNCLKFKIISLENIIEHNNYDRWLPIYLAPPWLTHFI